MTRALLLCSTLLSLSACEYLDASCDLKAASSVSITVVDQDGNPLSPTTLTYRVDGSDPTEAECWNEDCTQFVAGWETAGVFDIEGTYTEELEDDPCCWYDGSTSETVNVEDGECHVDGQSLILEIDTSQIVCGDSEEGDCG